MQLGPTTPANELSEQPIQGDPGGPEGATTADPAGATGWIERIKQQNPMLPDILLVSGVIVLVLVMFRSLRKHTRDNRRRDNALGSPAERIAGIHSQAQSSMEPATKLMVEAENIARRVGATLDNKAARLELLIEEADARLEQLNRALSRAGGANTASQHPPAPPVERAPQPAAPRTLDPTLLDRARVEQDLEDRQSRVAGRISPEPAPAETPPAEGSPSMSDQIHDLAESGLSSREIARELDQPIGQIELVLNLRNRKNQF